MTSTSPVARGKLSVTPHTRSLAPAREFTEDLLEKACVVDWVRLRIHLAVEEALSAAFHADVENQTGNPIDLEIVMGSRRAEVAVYGTGDWIGTGGTAPFPEGITLIRKILDDVVYQPSERRGGHELRMGISF